jgi:NitT/TauT family transport system ATP-binding protein
MALAGAFARAPSLSEDKTLARAPLLAFRSVSLSFGENEILRDIDLTIGEGEFVCVVGPSGCGKTTLLRLIAGLLRASAGAVEYKGVVHDRPSSDIAVVFQDYSNALLPWRTAEGNVSLALEAAGRPRRERPARIADLLRKVGLEKYARRFPAEMSGGMQQRLQIARCLAQEPSVLLMDEPFGALDAMTRQKLQDELLAIVAQSNVTAFFVTHDLEEAIYLGDRVVALAPHPGRVARIFDVPLPRPRDQLATRETPEFLHLRHELFTFIREAEA